MTQQVGRNDPCPCGSGKKYKHCCLPKDREANRFAPELSQLAPPPSFPETPEADEPSLAWDASTPDPTPETPAAEMDESLDEEEFWEDFWDDFGDADYQDKFSRFHHTIDEGIMEGGVAFDMLTSIRDAAVEHDERARFGELITRLRHELPAVYEEDRAYFISWEISDALVGKDEQALPALAPDLAAVAIDNIDIFNPILDTLAYHNQLELLVQIMRSAWPGVRDNPGIMEWGVSEFASKAADFELFLALERDPTLDPENQQLLTRLEGYLEKIDRPDFRTYVSLITGQKTMDWTPEAFSGEGRRSRGKMDEEERDVFVSKLKLLHFEFVGYLRHEMNVPYPRAELARHDFFHYVFQRRTGELETKETDDWAPGGKRRSKRRSKHNQQEPANILVPNHGTLDRFLAEQFFGFLTFLPHRAVAMFSLIPDWLRFLEKKGLATAEQRKNSLESLGELNIALLKVLGDHPEDPALVEPLLHWRGNTDI